MYDLIVLGGSAAGVSAAIYAARRKINVHLITNDFGGEITLAAEVENYLGFNKIAGYELAQKMKEQIEYNHVPYDLGFLCTKLEKIGAGFKVVAKNQAGETKEYETRAVVVATGAHPRPLGVPGEKELFHRGLTYCALCDAPLYRGKEVAVIGGGNSAIGSALMIAEFASKVYLVNKNAELCGENVLIDRVQKYLKIECLNNADTLKILGDKFVSGLEYKDLKSGKTKQLAVKGIFVNIGWLPNAEFIDWVEKNEHGEIIIDEQGETNMPGIYAAGDVTSLIYKQFVIAAGQGAMAALRAIDFLNKH